jgi:hypothetical protein
VPEGREKGNFGGAVVALEYGVDFVRLATYTFYCKICYRCPQSEMFRKALLTEKERILMLLWIENQCPLRTAEAEKATIYPPYLFRPNTA